MGKDLERVSILRLHPEVVLDYTFCYLLQLHSLSVSLLDEGITLKVRNWWVDFDFAGIALTTQVEHDHRNAEELRVATDIGRHGHLRLLLVGCSEVLQTFWWGSDSVYRDVFHDEISEFKVRLSV